MQPIFKLIAPMFIIGGTGLTAYTLDAKKPSLAAILESFTIDATIALM